MVDDITVRNREPGDALRHHSNGMTEAMQLHRESVMCLATRRWLSVLILAVAGQDVRGVLWWQSMLIASNLDEISQQNATLEKLNAQTWGVEFREGEERPLSGAAQGHGSGHELDHR
ncbi:hypothetical protein ETR_08561 [Erwinia tracheiphila PSU-1]|nr:hypothetical protein ETR_08561 [Erwinia tracheiphila PSU-1]